MIRKLLIGLVVVLLGIQLVPYGRAHSNPPVTAEPTWDSAQTELLFSRACADCHSNETTWPWYSNVAPVSWLVQHDVDEGRDYFNVSTWGNGRENEGHEAAETIRDGEMPPPIYLVTHPEARLSDSETMALIDGLTRTFGDERRSGD